MRLASDMPELHDDPPTLGMDGLGDAPPSSDLAIRIDTRRASVAVTADRGGRCFADDESTCRSTLRVVLNHQIARDIARLGAHAHQWRHDNTMGQLVRAELHRREEFVPGDLLKAVHDVRGLRPDLWSRRLADRRPAVEDVA